MIPVSKHMRTGLKTGGPEKGRVVRPLCFAGDDRTLAVALKEGRSGAMEVFYDRYASYIQRILVRIVHVDLDLSELLQEVFLEAFSSIRSLRDEARLKSWLTSIAVFTARKHIRKRFKMLSVCQSDSEAQLPIRGEDHEAREALRLAYAALNRLPADERIAFSLRFMEELELTEVAEACGVSLATIKRRLLRAKNKFLSIAEAHPVLREWIHRGDRWEVRS
jgi:RNA polymerase sigma-70 factor (ECF subfamily)